MTDTFVATVAIGSGWLFGAVAVLVAISAKADARAARKDKLTQRRLIERAIRDTEQRRNPVDGEHLIPVNGTVGR